MVSAAPIRGLFAWIKRIGLERSMLGVVCELLNDVGVGRKCVNAECDVIFREFAVIGGERF